jgi:hypothetical protein
MNLKGSKNVWAMTFLLEEFELLEIKDDGSWSRS